MNDGKKAEGYVQDALKYLEAKSRATYVRLYDSKSAGFGKGGNLIPPQPADFIVLLHGFPFLLEVKSSDSHDSLADTTLRSVFSAEQMLGAQLWKRALGGALCAFYSIRTGKFEIWDSLDIREAYNQPPRQRKLTAAPLATQVDYNNAVLSAAIMRTVHDHYSR